MKLTENQLMELKNTEIEILKSFISVCEKLNLKYYLLGGTLLGAIRHKGFIPWDDDIDIGMQREDYNIFIKEGQALLPKKYFIQNFISDPNFPANFTKIRDNGTTFLETSVKNFNINHGVFIDIFPLDFFPNDKKKQEKFYSKKKILDLRISSIFYMPNANISIKAKILRKLLYLPYPSYKSALKSREKLFVSFSDGEMLANHSGAWGVKEVVPQEWYGNGIEVEFEGLKVRAPEKYDKWLTQVYGDYMTLPPVEKRIPHHYIDIFDMKKSYIEYINKESEK